MIVNVVRKTVDNFFNFNVLIAVNKGHESSEMLGLKIIQLLNQV